jgi:hypothetical protein
VRASGIKEAEARASKIKEDEATASGIKEAEARASGIKVAEARASGIKVAEAKASEIKEAEARASGIKFFGKMSGYELWHRRLDHSSNRNIQDTIYYSIELEDLKTKKIDSHEKCPSCMIGKISLEDLPNLT